MDSELICMNTLCKPGDPMMFCEDCGKGIWSVPVACTGDTITYCSRCGHELTRFDKDIIDKAIERAEAVPYGEKIDFGKVLYGEEQ